MGPLYLDILVDCKQKRGFIWWSQANYESSLNIANRLKSKE